MNTRTEIVIGKENQQKLTQSTIAILGLGGVGGYVTEMFCRLGVGKLILVDFDMIDKTNLNRQIISLETNIGLYKTEEFEKRLKSINPQCDIKIFTQKIGKESLPLILNKNIDYVVDAIDDINAKIETIKFCKNYNIKIVSSMGTGNRFEAFPNFEIKDISKTSYDKLARRIRKMLKDENIKDVDVCFTKQQPLKIQKLGSVVYYPLMCAGTIVSFVANILFSKSN